MDSGSRKGEVAVWVWRWEDTRGLASMVFSLELPYQPVRHSMELCDRFQRSNREERWK